MNNNALYGAVFCLLMALFMKRLVRHVQVFVFEIPIQNVLFYIGLFYFGSYLQIPFQSS